MKDLTFFKVVRLFDGKLLRTSTDVPELFRELEPFQEDLVSDEIPKFHVFRSLGEAQAFVINVQELCNEMGLHDATKNLVVCKCFVHGTLRKLRGNLVADKIFLAGVVWLGNSNMIFNNDDEKGENTNELER